MPHVPPAARTLDPPAAVDRNQPLFNSPIKWVRGPVTHWDPRRTHESRAVPHEPPGGFPFLDLAAARALCLDPTCSSSSFCSVWDRCGGVVEKVPPKKKKRKTDAAAGQKKGNTRGWWQRKEKQPAPARGQGCGGARPREENFGDFASRWPILRPTGALRVLPARTVFDMFGYASTSILSLHPYSLKLTGSACKQCI